MKLALSIVLGLACVAFIEAAPPSQSEDGLYIRDHIKGLIELIREQASRKIDELKQQKDELMKKVKEAHGLAREEIMKKIDEISADIQKSYQDLLRKIKEIFTRDDETDDMDTYFKDALIEKIRGLRVLITEKTVQLARVIRDIAKESSSAAKEHLRMQRDVIIDQLKTLRDELMAGLMDLFRREQNEPEQATYGMSREVRNTLKQKMAEIKAKINELRAQLKTATDDKKEYLLAMLRELQVELRGIMSDVVAAIKEMWGPQTYAIETESDSYFIDTVRELRRKIQDKLELLKTLVALAKQTTGHAKVEAKKAIEVIKEELGQLRDEIYQQIREMFKRDAQF